MSDDLTAQLRSNNNKLQQRTLDLTRQCTLLEKDRKRLAKENKKLQEEVARLRRKLRESNRVDR